jgi:hypothetical protein
VKCWTSRAGSFGGVVWSAVVRGSVCRVRSVAGQDRFVATALTLTQLAAAGVLVASTSINWSGERLAGWFRRRSHAPLG